MRSRNFIWVDSPAAVLDVAEVAKNDRAPAGGGGPPASPAGPRGRGDRGCGRGPARAPGLAGRAPGGDGARRLAAARAGGPGGARGGATALLPAREERAGAYGRSGTRIPIEQLLAADAALTPVHHRALLCGGRERGDRLVLPPVLRRGNGPDRGRRDGAGIPAPGHARAVVLRRSPRHRPRTTWSSCWPWTRTGPSSGTRGQGSRGGLPVGAGPRTGGRGRAAGATRSKLSSVASKRQIWVGGVPVGGGAPVVVQSMTKTDTSDVEATLEQIGRDGRCRLRAGARGGAARQGRGRAGDDRQALARAR